MKAVWYERTGPAAEVLTFGDMPTAVAGPGEVRVRLEASGVNPADVGRRGGLLSHAGISTRDPEQRRRGDRLPARRRS